MTARVLTVALDPGDTAASRLHRTVLASLPARFRLVAGPAADVLLVSGDQAGWPELADSAASNGAIAVMLAGTRAVTAEAVRLAGTQAGDAGVLLTAAPGYSCGRSWTEALPLITADVADSVILDSLITVPEPDPGISGPAELRSALAGQLAVMRSLTGELGGLAAAHVSGRSYVLAGGVRGLTVTLSGAVSGTSGCLSLDLVGTGRHWHARFDGDALARPARISVQDAHGERAFPPVHESPYRTAWAGLHDAICQDKPAPYPADQLADDLALAESAVGHLAGER
jgi:hypothetical protein